MSTARFQSALAPWFERFVALKQARGASFLSQARILARFDEYIRPRIRNAGELGGPMLTEYVASTAHLAPRSRTNVACVIWPAVAYATRHGAGCSPLPERPRYPRSVSVPPHIYSGSEVDRILRAALELGPGGSLRPHTYATLLALLVTTGLRLGEARRLDLADIDFRRAILDVRQGKFRKSRRVPLHETTIAGLLKYRERRRQAGYPEAPDSPFFVTRQKSRPSDPAVRQAFRACVRAAGVRTAAGKLPRIHDLRHTFAVRRVVAWYQAGVDVNQRLSALATYLGHVDVNYTLIYLQPNEAMLREAAGRFAASCPISLVQVPEGRP